MTSSLGIQTFIESKSLARFCCEFLNLQHLAESAFSKSAASNRGTNETRATKRNGVVRRTPRLRTPVWIIPVFFLFFTGLSAAAEDRNRNPVWGVCHEDKSIFEKSARCGREYTGPTFAKPTCFRNEDPHIGIQFNVRGKFCFFSLQISRQQRAGGDSPFHPWSSGARLEWLSKVNGAVGISSCSPAAHRKDERFRFFFRPSSVSPSQKLGVDAVGANRLPQRKLKANPHRDRYQTDS